MKNSKPILLVESERLATMTVQRALQDLKVENQLVHTDDSEQALEYLKSEGKIKPCVILLDMSMPKTNGVEFLRSVKADKVLKKIPIVVLTASTEEQNVIENLKLSVAGYIVKPVDYKKFVEAVRKTTLHWTLSESPTSDRTPKI